MKKINILVFIFVSFISNAQDKKTYYFDEDSNQMNRSEFLKTNNGSNYFYQTFDIDTAYLSISFKRKNHRKLKSDQLKELVSTLEQVSKRDIKDSEFIVINYYPGKDRCNSGKTQSSKNFTSAYLKQLNKIAPVSQFWIYKSIEETETNNNMDWLEDKNQIVEKLFFKFHFPCFSFVVIKPNGEFISYYGEHAMQTVLDVIKELNKK